MVVAYSHRDGYDPLAVSIATKRELYHMAKDEMWTDEYDFEIPLLHKTMNTGEIAGYFGAFPVNRKKPGHSSFRRADDLVKLGYGVALAPEMTRYQDEENKIVRGRELGTLHEGAGSLAVRNGATLVPVGVSVLRIPEKQKMRVAKIAVVIGKPWIPRVHEDESKKDAIANTMIELRSHLQEAHDEAGALAA